MKTALIVALTLSSIFTASSASANFKVAEFTYGVPQSFKSTVRESLRDQQRPKTISQPVYTPGIEWQDNIDLKSAFGKR